MGKHKILDAFCNPKTKEDLSFENGNLYNRDQEFASIKSEPYVFDFINPEELKDYDQDNLAIYQNPATTDIYRNFLDWLFDAFYTKEDVFREELLSYLKLKKGQKVLVVSCGLGDDLNIILEQIGDEGVLHTQDLSKEMVKYTSDKVRADNVCFSVSNGMELPYKDNYFDAVFHFGGINLFGDVKHAISELTRVCRVGGRVVFGDEGLSENLKDTEYGKIIVNNNHLWGASAPMELLPENAGEIELRYMLGNCFYVIAYNKLDGTPKMDIERKHLGSRGGSPKTRYFGQLEGVTPETKAKFLQEAQKQGMSSHDFLEKIINEAL